MKPEFVHHLTLHFPIAFSIALGFFGWMTSSEESPRVRRAMRVGGWVALALATTAAVSGIIAAPGWFGGEGSEELSHHRWLGVTAWCVMALAAYCYDRGDASDSRDMRIYGVAMWWVGALAAVGAGHWGGLAEHPDVVPGVLLP